MKSTTYVFLNLGSVSNLDEFIKKIPEENTFTPMGSKIHSYTRNNEENIEYEVYHVSNKFALLFETEASGLLVVWLISSVKVLSRERTSDKTFKFVICRRLFLSALLCDVVQFI